MAPSYNSIISKVLPSFIPLPPQLIYSNSSDNIK